MRIWVACETHLLLQGARRIRFNRLNDRERQNRLQVFTRSPPHRLQTRLNDRERQNRLQEVREGDADESDIERHGRKIEMREISNREVADKQINTALSITFLMTEVGAP